MEREGRNRGCTRHGVLRCQAGAQRKLGKLHAGYEVCMLTTRWSVAVAELASPAGNRDNDPSFAGLANFAFERVSNATYPCVCTSHGTCRIHDPAGHDGVRDGTKLSVTDGQRDRALSSWRVGRRCRAHPGTKTQ